MENVALPLAYSGVTPVTRWNAASDMLERVGMRDREYFLPRHLSSGQAQRAAVARALVNKPGIIIADEPTGNLDSFDSKVVMELFADIHRQGNTILLVTHNPELTRYANRVIYMYDGAIVGDERTAIGTLARSARRIYFGRHRRSEEDITAGVSALMHDVPGKEITDKPKRQPPAKRKKSTSRRRKKVLPR
jgi:ABC-type lipoprotein export system ATPase subunit